MGAHREHPTKGGLIMRRFLSAIVVALVVTAVPALAGDFMTTGQTATISSGGNGFPCFQSPNDFDAFWNAKSAGDTYGMADAKQNAVILRTGWRVRMLGSDDGSKHSKIRIESGPVAGTACWVKFNPAGIVNV
jgi:hypothetical protein